jgi:hypothetical protein
MHSDECERWNQKTRVCSVRLTACNFFPQAWLDGTTRLQIPDGGRSSFGFSRLRQTGCIRLRLGLLS